MSEQAGKDGGRAAAAGMEANAGSGTGIGSVADNGTTAGSGPVAGKPARRRGFLIGAGAAGAAGAAAMAFRPAAAPIAGETAAVAPKEPAARQGYHETAHIRKYYDTTRT